MHRAKAAADLRRVCGVRAIGRNRPARAALSARRWRRNESGSSNAIAANRPAAGRLRAPKRWVAAYDRGVREPCDGGQSAAIRCRRQAPTYRKQPGLRRSRPATGPLLPPPASVLLLRPWHLEAVYILVNFFGRALRISAFTGAISVKAPWNRRLRNGGNGKCVIGN